LLHWRVCSVWDWLKIFAPSKTYGQWPTAILADAYEGDEAEEIAARTGCIGCPLVEKEKSLTEVLKIAQWKFLTPLLELKPIYREMRLPKYRHRKSGGELKKDGTLGKNQQRLGPLTLESRLYFLDKILDIQNRINSGSQTEKLFLINQEEESRIRELIANKTFPNKWTGEEITGDIILDKKYSDGSVMPIMFREWVGEKV
jgi:DNA sulfur modification protein DndC